MSYSLQRLPHSIGVPVCYSASLKSPIASPLYLLPWSTHTVTWQMRDSHRTGESLQICPLLWKGLQLAQIAGSRIVEQISYMFPSAPNQIRFALSARYHKGLSPVLFVYPPSLSLLFLLSLSLACRDVTEHYPQSFLPVPLFCPPNPGCADVLARKCAMIPNTGSVIRYFYVSCSPDIQGVVMEIEQRPQPWEVGHCKLYSFLNVQLVLIVVLIITNVINYIYIYICRILLHFGVYIYCKIFYDFYDIPSVYIIKLNDWVSDQPHAPSLSDLILAL